MRFRLHTLVGRYQLELTDEVFVFIETLVGSAPLPERSVAREDAVSEARGSEIEVHPDGSLVSRSRGREFFRFKVHVDGAEVEQLAFEKIPGASVRLEMRDADTLLVHQSGKFTAIFRRTAPASHF